MMVNEIRTSIKTVYEMHLGQRRMCNDLCNVRYSWSV